MAGARVIQRVSKDMAEPEEDTDPRWEAQGKAAGNGANENDHLHEWEVSLSVDYFATKSGGQVSLLQHRIDSAEALFNHLNPEYVLSQKPGSWTETMEQNDRGRKSVSFAAAVKLWKDTTERFWLDYHVNNINRK